MALPYTLDLAHDENAAVGTGINQWLGTIPAARVSGTADRPIQVQTQWFGGAGTFIVEIGTDPQTGSDVGRFDLTDELAEARLRVLNADGSTEYFRVVLADVDSNDAEPYEYYAVPEASARTLDTYAGTLRLLFETASDPVNADPGTVSAGTPSAAAGWEVAGPLPVNADFGTVSAGTPSAAVSPEPAEDPVDADPGTVSAGTPSAVFNPDAGTGVGVDANPGTVSTAAPSATLGADRIDAPVDADPGTVSAGAPTATLSAETPGAEVDANPGTVSSAAPTAVMRPDVTDRSVAANPGRVSAGAPSATLRAVVEDFSGDFAVAERAAAPRERILSCVEFSHPSLPEPARLVNDTEDRVVEGETYLATRFEEKLVDDAKRRASRASISVGNVGRVLSEWVESSEGGAGGTARFFEVLAVDGAVPEWEVEIDVVGIEGDSANVTISLGFDPLLGRPAVALRYDPETAPGLF